MRVTACLFGILRRTEGTDTLTVDLGPDSRVLDLMLALMATRPALRDLLPRCAFARDGDYLSLDAHLAEGDALLILPPPDAPRDAGDLDALASPCGRFLLTHRPLDAAAVAAKVAHPQAGAILTFAGTVREWTRGRRTVVLTYTAYEPMALRTMAQIGDEVAQRWPEARLAIAHRLGTLAVGELSIVIAASAPHRAQAYEASRYAIERFKQIVPIWKKEIGEDGTAWVGHQGDTWDPLKPLELSPETTAPPVPEAACCREGETKAARGGLGNP